MADGKLKAIEFGDEAPSEGEQIRYRWLVLTGVVGLAALVCGVILGVGPIGAQLVPSLLIDLGNGALLFVFLFAVERRAVRKVVRSEAARAFRSLTQALADPRDVRDIEEATAAVAAESEQLGQAPFDVAFAWLHAAAAGDVEAALYELSTREYRLCRVQDWVWNNRQHPDFLALGDRGEIAQRITDLDWSLPLTGAYVEMESSSLRGNYSSPDPSAFGIPSRRRVVAPGYELVILAPMSDYPEGILVSTPMLVGDSRQFLMHWTGEKWLLASDRAIAPPKPGFPPSWWVQGSVPEDALHKAGAYEP